MADTGSLKAYEFTRSSDTPTTFVPMTSVDGKRGIIAKPEVVPYSRVAKGYTYFQENDVLFSKITPCMQNGKHAIARDLIDEIGFGTTEFHVLRPKDKILPEYIHFFIRQPVFLKEAISYFTGAVGQQRIPKEFLINYEIPLPPFSEQKRIASKIQDLVQEIEHARTACEKQLEAAKALPSAYLREVFEGEEANKWKRESFEKCIDENNMLKIKGLPQKIYQETGAYPIVDQGHNLICGYTDDDNNVYKGQLPFIIFGDHTRIFKYIDFPFAVGADGTRIITPKSELVFPLYFYFALLNLEIRDLGYSRHYKLLKKTSIPIPELNTQRQIASMLKEKINYSENLRASVEKQLEAINAMPQAILRKAFRGEL